MSFTLHELSRFTWDLGKDPRPKNISLGSLHMLRISPLGPHFCVSGKFFFLLLVFKFWKFFF